MIKICILKIITKSNFFVVRGWNNFTKS